MRRVLVSIESHDDYMNRMFFKYFVLYTNKHPVNKTIETNFIAAISWWINMS